MHSVSHLPLEQAVYNVIPSLLPDRAFLPECMNNTYRLRFFGLLHHMLMHAPAHPRLTHLNVMHVAAGTGPFVLADFHRLLLNTKNSLDGLFTEQSQ